MSERPLKLPSVDQRNRLGQTTLPGDSSCAGGMERSLNGEMSSGSIADQHFYDDTASFDDVVMSDVAQMCRVYFEKYRGILEKTFSQRNEIKALELGAGTCCLGLLLSNFPFIDEIHCLDISLKKMQELFPLSCRQIVSHSEKLRFVRGDLGGRLEFEDQSFDLVVSDAALHHSRSIWTTLAESRRVLKDDGILVCQREAYLGLLTFRWKLDDLLKSVEVRSGVSENAYLRKQYEYYLKACGFEVHFLPVAESFLQRLLLPLNGWIYSKWVILAKKKSKPLVGTGN
jgi:ubiquinone/menaquinone biosynthesis C-methylase UbiE